MPEDSVWEKIRLTERVAKLREDYFKAVPEICIERPELITQFSLQRRRISYLFCIASTAVAILAFMRYAMHVMRI